MTGDAVSTLDMQLLQQATLFQGMNPDDLVAAVQTAHLRRVDRGGFFFHQGEPATHVFLLGQGQAKIIQVSPEGHQVILRLIKVGEPFGVIGSVSGSAYPVSAQADQACLAISWSGAQMGDLMEAHPRLALNILRLLVGTMQELQDRYRELATERVERRVARTLLRLVRHAGKRTGGGQVVIDMHLTRRSLAEMCGTTLYTVSRILAGWQQRGLIETGSGRVVIRYPHGLTAIAEDLAAHSPADAP